MHKLVAFFLALYVFGLTLIPCADKELNCQALQQIHTSSQANSTHQSHRDCCSPFCHCSCCNISMEITSPILLAGTFQKPQIFIYSYNPGLYSAFVLSVWEPPKA